LLVSCTASTKIILSQVKASWDRTIDASNGTAIIDVEDWMNRVALDSIGIAGFSHDFHRLDGKRNPIADAFDNLAEDTPSLNAWGVALANRFPFLLRSVDLPLLGLFLFVDPIPYLHSYHLLTDVSSVASLANV
jgi:hypothetical protein